MNDEKPPKEPFQNIPFTPKRIFVYFDGPEHSIRALNAAISMASLFSALVVVSHGVPLRLNGYGLGEPYYDWGLFEKSASNRIDKLLSPFVDAAEKIGVSVKGTSSGERFQLLNRFLRVPRGSRQISL